MNMFWMEVRWPEAAWGSAQPAAWILEQQTSIHVQLLQCALHHDLNQHSLKSSIVA